MTKHELVNYYASLLVMNNLVPAEALRNYRSTGHKMDAEVDSANDTVIINLRVGDNEPAATFELRFEADGTLHAPHATYSRGADPVIRKMITTLMVGVFTNEQTIGDLREQVQQAN